MRVYCPFSGAQERTFSLLPGAVLLSTEPLKKQPYSWTAKGVSTESMDSMDSSRLIDSKINSYAVHRFQKQHGHAYRFALCVPVSPPLRGGTVDSRNSRGLFGGLETVRKRELVESLFHRKGPGSFPLIRCAFQVGGFTGCAWGFGQGMVSSWYLFQRKSPCRGSVDRGRVLCVKETHKVL